MSQRFASVFDWLPKLRLRRKGSQPPSAARPDSPSATRPQRRWWSDTRVVFGVLLVVGCMLIGVRLFSTGSDEVEVWQVQRDLAAGAELSIEDLARIAVSPQLAAHYFPVDVIPDRPIFTSVLAGELLDPNNFRQEVTETLRRVTVPVEPLHAPVNLAPGDLVDLWSTPDVDLGARVQPELVLAGQLVVGVDIDARGFASDYGVVLEIDQADAGAVLAAVRSGQIDLVGVPLADRRSAYSSDTTVVAPS